VVLVGVKPEKEEKMNNTLNVIETRYSCRSYTGTAIEAEKVEAIALAAVQSPSGMNQQPWEITVITDKALIDEMDAVTMDMLSKQEDKALYKRMALRGGKIFYNAPCMFVIAKKPGTDLDCGIVSENIALAATSLNLGNVICGLARLIFDTEKGAEYAAQLIPEGYEFGVAVLVGYATEQEGTPHEPNMKKIRYIG